MLTFFLKLLFGSAILLLAALILNLIFRKASATVRHRIWAGSLVGLLILPIVSPLLPSWSFLPSRVETAETPQELALKPQAAPQNVTSQGLTDRFAGESQPPVELPHHFADEPLPEFLETSAVIPPGAEAQISDLSPASVAEEIVDETTAETQESQTAATKFAWLSVIAKPVLVVWCVGAMFLLMQLALSIGKVTRELSRLNLQELPLASKSRRKSVLCAVSHRAAVPFTCRVIRPVIVLPECSGQWSNEQRQAVLAHELAHIARNDVFWQVFSQVICAIYWFHPLVWLAANRIRIERELACDDLVLLGGEKPSLYAEVLLQLASGLHQRNNGLLGCMVAMARQHTVKTRIKAILNPNICRKQPGRVATLLMFLVAVICIAFAATASPFAKIQPVGFLNLDAISSDRTIHGEKNSQTIDCCNEIAKTMARVTGKKWYRSNSTLSLGNASLVAGQIRVFSADKPLLSGSSWYRITVDEGVLIEAASEKGFEKAAEHFAELVEFEGNRPRIAKGEYTGWNRKKKLTDDDVMNLVAIRQDAEKVTIKGRVTMPDGKPAKHITVDVRDFAVIRDEDGHYGYGSGCAASSPGRTDDQGYFEFEAIPGGILIVGVYREPVEENLVSDLVCCFTPEYFSNESLDIKLQPGVPVTIRVKHEDGSPVEGVIASWERMFAPPIKTYGNGNLDNNCNAQDTRTLANGETTLYVVPGEYELNVQSHSHLSFDGPKKLSIVEGERYEFEHTIPNPVRVRLLQVNGDPLANRKIKLMHTSKTEKKGRMQAEIVDVSTDANGIVSAYLWDEANYVFATSEDERFGIIKPLSHEDAGKTVDVMLERSTEFLVDIRNRNTQKPVANKELQCQIGVSTQRGSHRVGHVTCANKFKTDNDGVARFHLPPIPDGDQHLKYEPLLEQELDVRRTDSTISFGILTSGDDSEYEPLPESDNDGEKNAPPPRMVEVRGRVTYPDGSPGKDLLLYSSVRSRTKNEMGTEETDVDGYYSVKVPEFDGRTLDEMLALLAKKETASDEEKSVLPRVLRALRGKQENNEPLSEEEKFLLAEALRVHSENIRIATMERQALSAAEAIEKGEPILSGRVLDTEGNPIADACLNLGGGYYGQLYTDEQGNYQVSFPGEKSEKPLLLVLAKGYATAWVECDFDTPLEIRMERGETIRLRVVDSTGSPIPDVFINLRKYRSDGEPISMAYSINRDSPFERMMKTDMNGYWEMNVMPEDKIGYGFSTPDNSRAMGLYSSSLYLKPSEEIQEIVLPDRITISGKVSDAETGEPIPNLNRQVVAANYQWHLIAPKNMPDDGSYVFQIQDCQPEYTLEFSAEGYFPQAIPFRQEDGDQKFDLTMKPDRGLSGTLLDVSGKPAGGAVYLTKATNKIVKNGNHSSTASARRSGTDNQDMFFNCDNNGQFSFEKSFEECHLIVTNSQQGFAAMTREEFEKNGNVIQLRPWGRIEVTTVPPRELEIVLVPVEGQDFPNIPVLVPGESTRKANFNGQAAFESAFPDAKYYVKGYANMTGGTRLSQGDWLVARGSEPVSVGPGETLNIELSMIGRPVRLTPTFPGLDQLIQAEGTNERGIFSYRNIPLIAELHRTDDDLVLSGTYSSGRLTFYTVEPGTYRLTIRVEGAGGEAENVNGLYIGEQPIEIGEISDGWSVDVLDLGEMRLGPAKE